MTPLLALYCHLNDPVAGTVLLPTQTIIVLICIWYINQPIAPIRLLLRPNWTIVPMCLWSTDWPIDELYIQPLSPPNARTVLLPESDNCCTNMPATWTDNDYTTMPIVDRMIALIRLRSTDRMIVPVRLQSTDRLTDRWALCLTTITTRRSHRTATWIW